jgi:hypothetical protein
MIHASEEPAALPASTRSSSTTRRRHGERQKVIVGHSSLVGHNHSQYCTSQISSLNLTYWFE